MKKLLSAVLLPIYLVAQIALYVVPFAAWCYFIYAAANLEKYLLAFVGLIVPPIGVVGGILVWFGVILQPAGPQVTDGKTQLLQAHAFMTTSLSLIDRCKWSEFTARDKDLMKVVDDGSLNVLTKVHGATSQDVATATGMALGGANAMDCKDEATRRGVHTMLDSMRTQMNVGPKTP